MMEASMKDMEEYRATLAANSIRNPILRAIKKWQIVRRMRKDALTRVKIVKVK